MEQDLFYDNFGIKSSLEALYQDLLLDFIFAISNIPHLYEMDENIWVLMSVKTSHT